MMTKYLHLRFPENAGISNRGGATLAYIELDGFFPLNVAWCSFSDNFSRKIGRTVASNRLKAEGPLDVIEAVHPRTKALIDWAALHLYDEPVKIEKIGKHWIINL